MHRRDLGTLSETDVALQTPIPGVSHGKSNRASRSQTDFQRRCSRPQRVVIGDEAIGEIDHLLIEKISGRVAYAIMSFGGFLGLAHSHYPIPWSALKYDNTLQGYRTEITEAQLKDAPAFSDDSWTDRDWETRTHQHYRYPSMGMISNLP